MINVWFEYTPEAQIAVGVTCDHDARDVHVIHSAQHVTLCICSAHQRAPGPACCSTACCPPAPAATCSHAERTRTRWTCPPCLCGCLAHVREQRGAVACARAVVCKRMRRCLNAAAAAWDWGKRSKRCVCPAAAWHSVCTNVTCEQLYMTTPTRARFTATRSTSRRSTAQKAVRGP